MNDSSSDQDSPETFGTTNGGESKEPDKPAGSSSFSAPSREDEGSASAEPPSGQDGSDASPLRKDSSSSDIPLPDAPVPTPNDEDDPFAQFEGDLESDSTRIESQDLLAEQSTNIIEEASLPPYLEVEAGKDLGKQFVLGPGETGVGRSIDNDVILTDIAVSRRHLKIIREGNALRIRDLGSGNGTLLNGRRVFENPLVDGDHIALGETILVVRIPEGGALSSSPAEHVPTPGGPVSIPQDLIASNRGAAPQSTAKPIGEQPNAKVAGPSIVIPQSWFVTLVSVGLVLVLLLVAVVIALVFRIDEPTLPDRGDDVTAFERGVSAWGSRKWNEAEIAFTEVLTIRPGDTRAMDYLQQIRSAREHQQLMEEAKRALEGGNLEKALSRAASVPASSVYAADAEALRTLVRSKQVSVLVAAARAATAAGRTEEAAERLDEARTLDPKGEFLNALLDPSESSQVRPNSKAPLPTKAVATHTPPPTPPVAQPNPAREALSAYRQGDFEGAARIAREASNSASSGSQTELALLAERIERFATDYERVRRAGTNTASVVRQLENAIALDQQISRGHYRQQLQAPLIDVYVSAARTLWNQGQIPTACERIRRVLTIDARNANAQQFQNRCDEQVKQMFAQARSMETQSRRESLKLYRQILVMVPERNPFYRQASDRLTALEH